MIVTRTPFRISFAGGGSDLRAYYLKYGGAVLSTSIDKYIYLSMHKYFEKKQFFLKYSINEFVRKVSDIKHDIIRTVFKDYNINGVDFNSSSDVPAGTGLGSSSSFTVGIAHLCSLYTGGTTHIQKSDLAKYACEVEIEKLGSPIGKQDQYAAALGGMNFIEFHKDDTVTFESIKLTGELSKQLDNNLMMFYLGTTRSANAILESQKKNIISRDDKIQNLHKMVGLAKDLKYELNRGNIESLGSILHQGWLYKKELTSLISNPQIDKYYSIALEAGAKGGKLLGAGNGGFLLFYVPKKNQEDLKIALSPLNLFEFSFENTGTEYFKI